MPGERAHQEPLAICGIVRCQSKKGEEKLQFQPRLVASDAVASARMLSL